MKAFGIQNYGPPRVIEALTKDEPIPKDNQVKIKVSAFAINPYDAALRRGDFKNERQVKFPFILGSDLVGQIVEVGPAIQNYQVGDFVIDHRSSGAYSEYVTAGPAKLMPLPAGLPLDKAASLPTPGIAAFQAWHDFATITPDAVIGIVGVGGAVGSLLAQIAHHAGHRVIGIANSRHHDFAQKINIDQFAAYDQPSTQQPWQDQADVVFNAIFSGADHRLSEQLVKPDGQVIYFNAPVENDVSAEKSFNQTIVGYRPELKDKAAFDFWSQFISEHPLELAVQRTFKFEQDAIIDAHQLIEDHHEGKLVVWVNA